MSVMYANADDSFFKEHIWTESKIKAPNRDLFNPYPHLPPINRSRSFTLSSCSSPWVLITGLGLFLLLLMVGLTLFLFLSSIRNTSTNENRNIVAKEVGNIFNISKDPTSSTFRPTTVSPLITEDNRTTTTFVYYPGKVKRETATNYEQSQGLIDSQSFILLLLALICVTLT